jgi:hypothetical protein
MTRAEAWALYRRGPRATVAALLTLARRVAALEARLGQTSRDSSRPASTPPAVRARAGRPRVAAPAGSRAIPDARGRCCRWRRSRRWCR